MRYLKVLVIFIISIILGSLLSNNIVKAHSDNLGIDGADDITYDSCIPDLFEDTGGYSEVWYELAEYKDYNEVMDHIDDDIDIIYYDSNNLSKEVEKELENKIINHFKELNLNYEFDVHNEARMHLWKKDNENKNIDQYKNSEDAINQWIATVHAIGVTKENNQIRVYAPYGLSDIFSKTIRPIKHKNNSK